ncbi:MAG: hypothetical protein IJ583_06480 [Firmicutes bacterium]|nr:hypothetical protein [Bacillota bacterium]
MKKNLIITLSIVLSCIILSSCTAASPKSTATQNTPKKSEKITETTTTFNEPTTSNSNSKQYYSGYYPVIDFGAMFDVSPTSSSKNNWTYLFTDRTNELDNYYDALEAEGFVFSLELSEMMKSQFPDNNGYFVCYSKGDLAVAIGHDTSDYVYILIAEK